MWGGMSETPQWLVTGVAFGVACLLAVIWAYIDVCRNNRKLQRDLAHARDFEERKLQRQQRIAQREPYLATAMDVLHEVRRYKRELVRQAESVPVDIDNLRRVNDWVEKMYEPRPRPVKDSGDLFEKVKLTPLASLFMNSEGIGLEQIAECDTDWLNLKERLDHLRSHIADKPLHDHIAGYLSLIDEVSHFELLGKYVDKWLPNDIHLIGGMAAYLYIDTFNRVIDTTLTEVAKRIEELRSGDRAR